ncbi:hypothetical protein H0H93_004937 [Arthromyces matolae]|nr:hypothetical protein H0H93_004937 [Arthromyces matolae]
MSNKPQISQPPALPPGPQPQPLIPDKYLDIPSQRLYYLSLGLLCQAIKIVDFGRYLIAGTDGNANCRKWLFVDFAYCTILSQLRIPRLSYSRAIVFLQVVSLWFMDGLMFGGISVNLPLHTSNLRPSQTSASRILENSAQPSTFLDYISPLTFGLFGSFTQDGHLTGQHTVRMSPISTAQLNPDSLPFCLSPQNNFVLIPVLLNNTNPAELKFAFTTLGQDIPHIVELTSKDLKSIEQDRIAALQALRPAMPTPQSDDYDEYDDENAENAQDPHSTLQSTQSLVHIRVTTPGTLRLESLIDDSRVPVRISYPSTVTVVPCPTVEFIDEILAEDNIRCSGEDSNLQLMIRVYGVPPLSLRWFKTINGRREHFLVEGIESNNAPSSSRGAAAEMKIPLPIAFGAHGTYLFALEEVTDHVGNVVRVGLDTSTDNSASIQTKTTRSLVVLRRPKVSFKSCGPGFPTSLLIGSETTLGVALTDADNFDFPWELSMGYEPFNDNDTSYARQKSWKKTMKSQGHDFNLLASAPGRYTILGVEGKRCAGDVLAPESCDVVEKPLPTAEIEWRRIHECSGDTGVSASLVLRGTPPFQVYYRMQRDNETPRDLSKTFASSRGELTLQPDRSGHYTFTFTQMSDAYYKKVKLNGPSIDKVIHPLAAADFVATQGGIRRKISTCEGDAVSVDVELKIADSHCLGTVLPNASTFEVYWIPRPTALLSSETKSLYESHNSSHILAPVCEASPDYVDLDLTGRPPFEIMYNIAQNDNGGTKVIGQPTFNSIQARTRFQLQTTPHGRMYYEVKQIGDANYPLAKHRNIVIPRSDRLLFEQEVFMRPSARFKTRNRLSYCLNDQFLPVDGLSVDGTILLEGVPPFTLSLSIKNLGTSQIDTTTVRVLEYSWKIDLPSYVFRAVGPHLITIESIHDASNCAPAAFDPLSRSIWVDVAETAAIVPFDHKVDYCVGEAIPFQLEGIPPWNIGYRINGKAHIHDAKVSPVSLTQQQPGEFTITSIAHQQKLCKAAVTDLHFKVHPLPSAQVGHGKRIYQDIHEGDQAEIVFTLIGVPPFTFTYQRSELSSKKGGKTGKVLETHTVSRIMTNEYSLFSALEGTWTVTSISDRYCRYPPAQPDIGLEKQRV